MGKQAKDLWVDKTSVFLVVELLQDRSSTPHIAALISLPGREGTFMKRWKTVQGRLDANQVMDLLGWVQLTAHNALVSWTGTQGVLPME